MRVPEISRLTIGDTALFRFIFREVGTNMYVLPQGQSALIVDPHPSAKFLEFLCQRGITDCTIILTHEHADHTCGIYSLQQKLPTRLLCQKNCAEAIADHSYNSSALVTAMLSIQDSRNGTRNAKAFQHKYEAHEYTADIVFEKEYLFQWQGNRFWIHATPGHSKGSCCILWNDAALFTGDSLLRGLPVITRIPGGNNKAYKNVTLPFFHSQDQNLLVLPGHGLTFRLGDELTGNIHVESK